MKGGSWSNFVEQLKRSEDSLEYFMSVYDSNNEKVVKACYQQLDLSELSELKFSAMHWKDKLKCYNILKHISAYNCISALQFLIEKRILYLILTQSKEKPKQSAQYFKEEASINKQEYLSSQKV